MGKKVPKHHQPPIRLQTTTWRAEFESCLIEHEKTLKSNSVGGEDEMI